MLDTFLLILTIVTHFATLWRIFQKAGRKAWEGLIPIYNLFIWLKLMRKPGWWALLFLVPGVNFLMVIIMHVETVKMFGRRDLKNGLIAIFLPWLILPYLAFNQHERWNGPYRWLRKKGDGEKAPGKFLQGWRSFRDRALKGIGVEDGFVERFDEIPDVGERPRTASKEWGDAIIFAVVAATIIRGFFLEAFTIPTPSMERSLLVGDYLFVSKMSYGARVPQTPIAFPFAHHTLPFTQSTPSYLEWYTLPYKRSPGFGKVERNDVVVFNFPAGDTVATKQQNKSYYQLCRQFGRERVHQDERRFGEIISRPVDKRDNYIKRCVGIPGDTIQIVDDRLHVNGEPAERPEHAQWNYIVEVKRRFRPESLLERFDIEAGSNLDERGNLRYDASTKEYTLAMTLDTKKALEKTSNVRNIRKIPEKPLRERAISIFPHDRERDWGQKNFGPLWIPKKGATVELTRENLPLYERIIDTYEGHDLEVDGEEIRIDGKVVDSYTFEMDYYWMMGDNRHSSLDSRYWGFVPEDHVVGEALFIWFSKGAYEGIRWERIFSGIS